MRRKIISISVILLLSIGCWFVLDTDKLFKDVYYMKVPSADSVEKNESTFYYNVIGYDKEGKKRALKVESPSLMAEGDVLKVYVKGEEEVTAYEIAKQTDVPPQLKHEQSEEGKQ